MEEDDLAGLEDVSSDGDESYEAESTDNEAPGQGNQTGRRPYRRRGRGIYQFLKILTKLKLVRYEVCMQFIKFFCVLDNSEPTPLMEGEGRSFRVLGFNQSQRAIFVQTLMRYLLYNKAFRHKNLDCLFASVYPQVWLYIGLHVFLFCRLAKTYAGLELEITTGRSLFLA